jgi:hypothetical protein
LRLSEEEQAFLDGPGELLLRFGTDAAAMRDRGVVCEGVHEARRVLGLRVTCPTCRSASSRVYASA